MTERDVGLVLLDVGPGEAGDFDRSILERLGHPVTVCRGPEIGSLCPILGGSGCERFDAAHGVVFALDLDRAQHREILRTYAASRRDDVPVRVVCSAAQAARYAALLHDVEVWEHEPTVAELDGFAAEVEAADRFA
jgi:hypothetical protein